LGNFITSLPSWLSYTGIVILVLISIYGGFFLARLRKKQNAADSESSVNTIVGTTMGLLAFILAFTFGVTTSRYDTRKDLMLQEINAIETTFLRADLIPESQRNDVRSLLKKYVDLRIDLYNHPENLKQIISDAEDVQVKLWSHAKMIVVSDLKNADITSLFVDSLNEMFELQTQRVTVGSIFKLHPALWAALFIITVFSMMGVGYLFGLSENKPNLMLSLILSISFAVVIMLIVDLDRSGSKQAGIIKVPTQPIIDLRERMEK
jgi:hypothetical protein